MVSDNLFEGRDEQGTFDKIASYLKKDGIFIFSWHHTLNYCIAWSCDERREVFDKDQPIMMKSYFEMVAAFLLYPGKKAIDRDGRGEMVGKREGEGYAWMR